MRKQQRWVRVVVWVTVAGMVITLFASVIALNAG